MKNPVWRSAFGGDAASGQFPVSLGSSPSVDVVHIGYAAQASPVFSGDGTAFIADRSGMVGAYDKNLNEVWSTLLPGGITAAPCVSSDDASVFVGTHQGYVVALDASDGSIRWNTWLDSDSDPRILSDLLYTKNNHVVCSSWGGWYCALNPESGDIAHTWSAGVFARCPATEGPQTLNTASVEWTDERKALVFTKTDEATWDSTQILVQHTSAESPKDAGLYSPPQEASFGTLMFCNRKSECLITIWPNDPKAPQQTMPFGVPIYCPAALHDRGFYFNAMNGYLYSFKSNGRMNYAYKSEADYLLAAPVADSTHAYFGDPMGRIHQVDASGKGRILAEQNGAFEGRFAFSPDGQMYAPCSDGYLVVLSG